MAPPGAGRHAGARGVRRCPLHALDADRDERPIAEARLGG